MNSSSTSEPVTSEIRDGVTVITLDDGKANALSHALIDALDSALDSAEGAPALVVMGRPGKFCAGFDLSVVREGPTAAAELMTRGAHTALRLFEWPAPTVFGVSGHALAMGAVLLGCPDLRVGAEGDFKIGLNELAIGLAMPEFASELVRPRLSNRHFHESVVLARIYSPSEARDVGYLDEVVDADALADTAVQRSAELAERLNAHAFAKTRTTMRGPLASRLRDSLGAQLRAISD